MLLLKRARPPSGLHIVFVAYLYQCGRRADADALDRRALRLQSCALGHLIESGAIGVWMEKSNEPGVELVPKNVLHAAARCPLIRVGNEVGFDVATFHRLALELAVPE